MINFDLLGLIITLVGIAFSAISTIFTVLSYYKKDSQNNKKAKK